MKATVFLRLGLKLVCLTIVNFCLIVVAHLIAKFQNSKRIRTCSSSWSKIYSKYPVTYVVFI